MEAAAAARAAEAEGYVEFGCADGRAITVRRALAEPRSPLVAAAGTGALVAVELPAELYYPELCKLVQYWTEPGGAPLSHDDRIDLLHAAQYIGDEELFQKLSSRRR